MRHERLSVTLTLAFVGAALLACGFAAGAASAPMPPRAPAVGAAVTAVAQDAPALEAALGLDLPTRRLIQHGLLNTGYLDRAQAETLQAAGSAPAPAAIDRDTGTVQAAGSPGAPEPQVATAAPPPAANVLAGPAVAEASEAEPLHAADAPPSGTETVPAAPAIVESAAAPAAAVLSLGDHAPAAAAGGSRGGVGARPTHAPPAAAGAAASGFRPGCRASPRRRRVLRCRFPSVPAVASRGRNPRGPVGDRTMFG